MKKENKIIAEFMRGQDPDNDTYQEMIAYNGIIGRFHESWDWLMPVVEKIEGLEFKFCIEKNNYSIDQFIEEDGEYDSILYFLGYSKKTKIEMVYQAVVDFIKWYNKQK